MRIIAGAYRGRTITTAKDLSIRPATDRVRTTIFDILTHRLDFADMEVLDLFAGSGSLGFECLSRGAGQITFVETSAAACVHIEKNAEALGCADRITIIRMDACAFLERAGSSYGVIFADPPYAYPATSTIPHLVFSRRVLHPDGYLLIEHAAELVFPSSPDFAIGPERKFGRTHVTFFQGKSAA